MSHRAAVASSAPGAASATADGSVAEAVLRASVPLLGVLRLALGAWAGARPTQVAAGVGVDAEQRTSAVPYVYALAAREVVLGLGALRAWSRGDSGAIWVAAMAASDAFDALVYEVLAEIEVLDRTRSRRSTWFALSGAVPEAVTAVALARHSR
jgi:hypothetical protein